VRELRLKAREARDAAGGDAAHEARNATGGDAAPEARGTTGDDAALVTRRGPPSGGPDHPAPCAPEALGEDPADEGDLVTIRFAVPRAIRAAIEEARELHRAVSGGETTTSEFIEALLAESAAGPVDRLQDEGWIGALPSPAQRESALEQKGEKWSFLKVPLEGQELCEARQTLDEVARVFEEVEAARGSADAAIRALLRLENEIELRLGELLARMGESGAWEGLCFSGVGHYAEERLGISRSVGQSRFHLARLSRVHRGLQGACESGKLGLEAAAIVARLLEREHFDPRPEGARSLRREENERLENAWIRHAEESTLKRLREELRIVERDRSIRPGACSEPIDDETWQRSRSRRAGQAREALALLTRSVLDAPVPAADTVIRFRLPIDLASLLLATVREERRRLNELCGNDEIDPAMHDRQALRVARVFSKRCAGVPEWCALYSLIEDFVDTWDDPRQSPKRAADRIYIRDGWRCAAPGCTSRRNLEEHHIVYRSHGGDHSPSNRVTLCRFHHQQGEHRGLMKCRGKAPLGITWLMGRRGAGGVFRNERRLRQITVSEQPVLAAGAARTA